MIAVIAGRIKFNLASSNHLRKLIAALLVVANCFVIGISGYALYKSRLQIELRVQSFTQNTAHAVDYSLSNNIKKIDLALMAVADEMQHHLAKTGRDEQKLSTALARYQSRVPEVGAFRISNAEGNVIFERGWDPTVVGTWPDREYYSYLKSHPDAGLQISKPLTDTVTKKVIVVFYRRYTRPDGTFGGMVAASMSLNHFNNLLSQFHVLNKVTLVFLNADLDLIARTPSEASPAKLPGSVMISNRLKELLRSGTQAATYDAVLPVDQRDWTVSYRRMNAAPMIVLVGVAKDDYLVGWYAEATRTAFWTVAFLLLSLFSGRRILRLQARIDSESELLKKQQIALIESENRSRQSEERYRLLLQNSPLGILHYDRNLVITYANDRFAEIMQAPKEYLLGLACSALQDQSTIPAMRQALAGEVAHYEGTYVTSYGHVQLWLSMYCGPVRNVDGEILGGVVIIEDITERMRIEEEQRRQQEALLLAASVFTHAHEGIVICDANQVILDVNPTFSEITGYEREEILGKTPHFLSSGRQDAAFYKNMWQSIREQGYWHGEAWNRRKDGSCYAERLSISSVINDQNQVTHYIGTFSDISLIKHHQAELERMAHYDQLTNLPNRTLLSDRMEKALAQARRNGSLVTVCYLDLDGFKAINDELGHQPGDIVLIEVARRLNDMLRATDTVARLGGDEFVLLLIDVVSQEECEQVADRVLRAIATPIPIGDLERCVSGSLGIAIFPTDGADAGTLLRHADHAMYMAKESGKNRYVLFNTSSNTRAHECEKEYYE